MSDVVTDVLNGEIEWCRKNRGKSGRPKAFEQGFIAGLRQAKMLAKKAKRLYVEDEPKKKTKRRLK